MSTMTRVTERCGCGATFNWIGEGTAAAQQAAHAWRVDHRHSERGRTGICGDANRMEGPTPSTLICRTEAEADGDSLVGRCAMDSHAGSAPSGPPPPTHDPRLLRRGVGLAMSRRDEQLAEFDHVKRMIRDLGDMACIGCRAKTCPACGLAAEITGEVSVLLRTSPGQPTNPAASAEGSAS